MLLDINKYILDNELKFITTSNIFIKDKYDPNGLFSNMIFGIQGSKKWRNTFAAITLNCRILHPVLFDIANRRCSHFMKLFTGEASLVKNGDTYVYVLGDEGEWGIDFFINNFNQIIPSLAVIPGLTDNGKRLLRYIASHQEVSFINNMLVIPPLFRPAFMKGMEVEVHPINDIYTELIRDAQLIKTTPMSNARKKILVKLQTSSYKIYKELQDWIKGKYGLTRTSILGKTLDFSGRAVITGDVEIDSDQIGVPFKMLVVLFAPFVIHKATHAYKSRFEALGIVPAIMNINKIIKNIQEGSTDISQEVVNIMIDICKEICSEKVVIAKRDPSLFRLSVRAYKPVLVFDSTIHINPLVTTGHGADFDGDQMAIIVPITDAAQQEARDTMLVQNNMFSPNGKLSMEFNNDFILGVYLLSKEPVTLSTIPNVSDIDSMLSLLYSGFLPNGVVSYKGKNISLGRLIISHYVGIPINEVLPSKKLKPIINSMPDRFPNSNDIVKNLNALMRCAGKVPTLIGKPLSAMEFSPSDELMAKIKQSTEDKTLGAKIPEYTQEFLNNKRDSDSLISDLIDSGGRGNATQIQQTSIAKGYISDMSGKTTKDPIAGNLINGMTSDEYFNSSVGGRKGIADRSISTSTTGYLMRQYIYALSSVKYNDRLSNCGTNHFLKLFIENKDMASSVMNRYLRNGTLITDPNMVLGKEIEIYSPMGCKSVELCKRCAGNGILTKLNTDNIGLMSAQYLGERGTQLAMKTFHMGGAASVKSFLTEHTALKDLCYQDNANVVGKAPFDIILAQADYDIDDEGFITTSILTIKSSTIEFELDLNYDFIIMADDEHVETDDSENMIIHISEGMVFGSMRSSAPDVVKSIKQIIRIMDNKTIQGTDLLLKLWNTYSLVEIIPFLQLEILVSQLHRDPTNPAFPYRLSNYKYPPMRIGLKKIAMYENWKRGAAFENVGEALHYAVLNNPDTNVIKSDLDDLRAL